MASMHIHGIHAYPWHPCISMASMHIHGIHAYPRAASHTHCIYF
jgi:hypothetical protein